MVTKGNVTIAGRLRFAMGTIAAITFAQILVGMFLQYKLYTVSHQQNLMAALQADQSYADMKHDVSQSDLIRVSDAAKRHDANALKREWKTLAEDSRAIDDSYGRIFSRTYEGALQSAVEAVHPTKDAYVSAIKEATRQLLDQPDANTGLPEAYIAAFNTFADAQDKLIDQIKEANDTLVRESTQLLIASAIMTLAAIGAVVVALFWANRSMQNAVVRPIESLTTTLSAMANGDYDSPINGDPDGDEVQRIYSAAAVFRTNALAKRADDAAQTAVVAALSDGLDQLAEQNLEYRIAAPFPPRYEQLRETFNHTLHSLSTAMLSVRTSASSLTQTITEIRSASDDLASRNAQQAATLEETSAAMKQVTIGVQATARGAADVRRQVTETHDEVAKGETVVSRAVAAMAAIESSASEISQIIGVIDGIAFQTNLLALNAGVEAARAGESGRGFAVVATEVRALAQRSADAAKDIKELIAASAEQVGQGVELVHETGTVLSKILTGVRTINQVITDITQSADKQAETISQVNTAVGEIDRVTQQNAAMVEQTNAATRELANEATELATLVSAFRTSVSDKVAQMDRMHSDPMTPGSYSNSSHMPKPLRLAVPAISGNLALEPRAHANWNEF